MIARSEAELPSVGTAVALYSVFLFSITVHEFAHAATALRFGDRTATELGRLTLNPIPHMNLFGTVILPLLGLVLGGYVIGFASTPVNPSLMRRRRIGRLIVSLAGPGANIVISAAAIGSARLIVSIGAVSDGEAAVLRGVFGIVAALAVLNALLAVFNLLPVPPLDGAEIVRFVLGDEKARSFDRMAGLGFLVVLALLPILGRYIFGPMTRFVSILSGSS